MRKVMKIISEAEKQLYDSYQEHSEEIDELNRLIESLKQDPNDMRTLAELLNDLYK